MRRTLVTLAIISCAAAAGPVAAQNPEEAEIRSVAMRQGETWSRHDAKAYAALFTEDCDVVNVVGARDVAWPAAPPVEVEKPAA